MRWITGVLLACSSAYGLSNAITIKEMAGTAQPGRPFTVSRFFAKDEIPDSAHPRINGVPAAVWQCDKKTTWAGGSLQHALISFQADLPKRGAIVVDFVNDTARSSAGAPLTQQQMLEFDAGGGPGSWDAQLDARAPFVTSGATATHSVNARAILGAGKWRYWLSGPAVTQVIVEDRGYRSATDQTAYDFGWQRAPTGSTAAATAADQTSISIVNPGGWAAPFTATLEGEDVYVCAAERDTVTIGTPQACPSVAGRGYNGTRAAAHPAGKPLYPNLWKDAASIQYKSLHPIFVLTFYPGWKGVKADFIMENAWSTRAQDLAFAVELKTGKPLSTVYTRPTAFDWYQALSRRRKTLWSGQQPGTVSIDYNFAYLVYSRAIPNYDVDLKLSNLAYKGSYRSELDYYNVRTMNGTREPQYCQSPSPIFAGNPAFCGEWWMRTGDAGGRPDIGVFPLWYIRYLYSMANPGLSDAQRLEYYNKFLIDNAEASATAPIHIRESSPGRFFDSARKVNAFGFPLSVNARPTIRLDQYVSKSGQQPEDALTAVGPVLSDQITPVSPSAPEGAMIQRWSADEVAHQPSFAYIPYLITGDWFYLEEQYFLGSLDTCVGNPTDRNDSNGDAAVRLYSNSTARHGNWGFISDIMQARGLAWALRSLGHAALAAPDGQPEKAYYTEILNNNIQIREGRMGIRNGAFPPVDPTCANFQVANSRDKWCWGRMVVDAGQTNPLHIVTPGNDGMRSGLDPSKARAGDAPWMQNFIYIVLGHLEELGFQQISPFRQAVSSFLLRQLRDGAYNPYLAAEYHIPTLCVKDGSYCRSMAGILAAYQLTAPLTADLPADAESISIAGNVSGTGAPRMDGNMPLTVQIGSEQVRICNAAAGAKASTLKVCQGGRGWAKTRPVNHSAGEPVTRILDAFSAAVSDPDQGYAYFAYAASVYLASLTVNDSITGAPITGDSAIEWMWAHLPGREKLADDPKWAYQPRMQIASVAVAASATDAHLSYTSPVAGACRIGLGDGSLRSSDDAGDEAASGDTSKREHTFSGLKPGSTYQYRITCGTKKQPVRALGFFQTK